MQTPITIRIYYAAVVVIASVIAITGLIGLQYSQIRTHDLSIIKSTLTEYCVYESEE